MEVPFIWSIHLQLYVNVVLLTIPAHLEYTIKDHKETDEIKNKKEYTESTEKRVSVLVEQSTFKSFSSEKDGRLFKLKDIEVDFHDNKISNCEAVGGAGGAMYIENTNDVNYRISIKNIQFSNCKADYGGALYVYSTSSNGDILISFCRFSSNTASPKGGGSALYFCSNKGKIKNCEFIDNKGGSALKIVEPSQASKSIKLASPSQTESISFFNCNFLSNKESKESIYFASRSGSKTISIVKCTFKGKLAKGINYIDGELTDNKQPAIHLYDCKFEKVAVNKKLVVSSSSSLSSKSFFTGKYINVVFMCFAALAFVTFVAFLALKFKKSHQEIQEDDEDDSKTIINESL
ncbi:hypothetical protein M9Y10_001428 [Tritrichomonas musculus]|uniref:Right handed beta helix domain-containing protein n=1 Tax=Tritrichomonas musculus TaxID=1915356 RepID=A0ABR2L7B9_9EUKA